MVLCLNGGTAREVPGTWSATVEWLVARLARRFPRARFAEVRYRVKSWNRLDSCVADAAQALAATGPARHCLLGFSMGGAVAIASAGAPGVTDVVALAPWIPERMDLAPLAGRRVTVVQGSVDGHVPGVPGISPAHSRAGFERMRAAGVDATYQLIRGGLHGTALRAPWGGLVRLPRAGAWERRVAAAVGQALS